MNKIEGGKEVCKNVISYRQDIQRIRDDKFLIRRISVFYGMWELVFPSNWLEKEIRVNFLSKLDEILQKNKIIKQTVRYSDIEEYAPLLGQILSGTSISTLDLRHALQNTQVTTLHLGFNDIAQDAPLLSFTEHASDNSELRR